MKRLLFGFLLGLGLGTWAHSQSLNFNSAEQQFIQGGRVRLQLKSGDYRIRASKSDRIAVYWDATDSYHDTELSKIKVQTKIAGGVVTIRTDGPVKYARFTIEIPARSDLELRMTAGDIQIDGIEGNKDIRMTAGDLKINIIPAAYSTVHASVKFGDLNARPLGISKDGMFRSLNWTGRGTYTLNASLFAGDLTISQR